MKHVSMHCKESHEYKRLIGKVMCCCMTKVLDGKFVDFFIESYKTVKRSIFKIL